MLFGLKVIYLLIHNLTRALAKMVLELFCNYQCFRCFPISNLHRVTHRVTTFFKVKNIQGKTSVLVLEKQIFESKVQIFLIQFYSLNLIPQKINKLYVKTYNFCKSSAKSGLI